jgi:hypothetical protein
MVKLYQYRVHGISLTSRTEQVKVIQVANNQLKEYLSSNLPVTCGVPQGSVLGSLLFIFYVSDVLHLTQGRTIMYADDTSMLNTGQDINELKKA